MSFVRATLLLAVFFSFSVARAEEPPLPLGLEIEPDLPAGLEMPDQEPDLPLGLDAYDDSVEKPGYADEKETDPSRMEWQNFQISGFAETRGGFRTQNDPSQKDASIGEGRLQLQAERSLENLHVSFTSDFLYDEITEEHSIDLERGEGWFDLREASLLYRLGNFADVKLGRQVLTWGTGDLIFINDLFPKDWNSFFIGRDEEYLKAPSDALKASFFNRLVNLFRGNQRRDADFNCAAGVGHQGAGNCVYVISRLCNEKEIIASKSKIICFHLPA